MFYEIYEGIIGISLPPEVSHSKIVSRFPNCVRYCQLATLSDTYQYSLYPTALRTWNSLSLSLIADSIDEFMSLNR